MMTQLHFRRGKVLLFFLVIIICGRTSFAQSLSGKVTDKSSGELLPDAVVWISKPKITALTNQKGEYILNNVPEGEILVRVSFLGYALESKKVTVVSEGVTNLNFELTPEAIQQEQVVVTANKLNIARANAPINVSVLNQKEIDQSVESNVLPILGAKVPGLFITERGVTGFGVAAGSAGKISIRGVGGSSQTFPVLMLIDGQPQFVGIFGHAIPDSYVSSDVEKVEVIKGPASVLYGTNAMGGVINIITRKPKELGVSLKSRLMYGSFNTKKIAVSTGYRGNKLSLMASYNHDQTDGDRPNSDFKIDNGYIKLGYEFSEHFSLSADVTQSIFKAYDPGSIYYEDLTEYDNKSHWVDITRTYGYFTLSNKFDKIEGGLKAYYMHGDHDIYDGWHSIDENIGLSLYQGLKLFDNNLISFGIELKNYGGKGDAVSLGELNGQWLDVNETGIYLIAQHTFFDKLTLNSGVRHENHSLYGSNWIPQFGASFDVSEVTVLKASVSKGFRSPSIRELYLFPIANADLQPETMWNYEASVIHRFDNQRGKIELTGFIAEGDNLILVVPNPNPPPPVMNKNSGTFSHKGVEIDFNYRVTNKLNLQSSYSYLSMDAPKVAAPKHQLFTGASYHTGKFDLNLNIHHINELYTSIQPEAKQNYTLLNSKVNYHVNNNLSFFVSGENLLDQDYQVQYGYPMPGATLFTGVNISL